MLLCSSIKDTMNFHGLQEKKNTHLYNLNISAIHHCSHGARTHTNAVLYTRELGVVVVSSSIWCISVPKCPQNQSSLIIVGK